MPTSPRPLAVLALLPAAAVVTLGIATSVLGPVPAAEARPEYAKKEKKDCSFCHVDPKGGGPRNATGQDYERNGHRFLPGSAGAGGYGEDKAFSSEATGKAFDLVRKAIDLTHWSDALKRIAALKPKERKGPAAQLLLNTEAAVDNRGRDLAKAAKDAVASGQAPVAAEALARLEREFSGRDPAKEVGKIRGDLAKLPGGKEADAAAKVQETLRIAFLDALMKDAEGQRPAAVKALTDLLTRAGDGPLVADVRKTLADWGATAPTPPPAPAPAMGG